MKSAGLKFPVREIVKQAERQLKEQGYETRKCGKCGSVQFKVGWKWKCIECRRGLPTSQRN